MSDYYYFVLAALGRKMRIWERRLLRDFHVVSVAGLDEEDQDESNDWTGGSGRASSSHGEEGKENAGDKFRKLASVAVAMNAAGISPAVASVKGRTIKPL